MNDSLPDTRQLLLIKTCLASSTESTLRSWTEWRSGIDIDHLDEGSNRLLPLLYRKLEHLKVSDSEIGRLGGVYRYHWVSNHLLMSELHQVLFALREASVDVMLLKGAALISRYYHDPGIRPMSDLDIMVRPHDLNTASEILMRLGWAPRINRNLNRVGSERLVHAIDFVRSRNGRVIELDVHWTPLHRAKWVGVEETFWQHSQMASVNGVDCRVLDPTHQLLHICLHGGSWNTMPPFRWIVDAHWILIQDSEQIDWHRLLEQARTYNGFMTLKTGLSYLHGALSLPIPQDIIDRLSDSQPTRLELLEHRLMTEQIPRFRLDLLLLLEWMNHSRAHLGENSLARLAGFPVYLKLIWKLDHWHQMPFFILRRLMARLFLASRTGSR
jgi:hypothetical protein